MEIKYKEKKTLACRDAINSLPDEDVEGLLLVGEKPAIEYEGHGNRFGRDVVYLYPAIYNGQRAWLKKAIWNPASGYCAEGTSENILPFEEGVKILIEKGAFSFPIPK